MIPLEECLKVQIPSSLRAPSEELNIDLATQMFGTYMIQQGVSLDAALAIASGLDKHIEQCRNLVGNYGLKGMKGILQSVTKITRYNSSNEPYVQKGLITLRFDEDSSKDEEINTGILNYCDSQMVPDSEAFEVALANTVFSIAEELVGQKFAGNKLGIMAPTRHSDQGIVRLLVNIFPTGDAKMSDGDKKGSGRGHTERTRISEDDLVNALSDKEFDDLVSKFDTEDDFWNELAKDATQLVNYHLDENLSVSKTISKLYDEMDDKMLDSVVSTNGRVNGKGAAELMYAILGE